MDPTADAATTIKAFDELTPRELHDLLRLRAQVFVLEQDCVYLDLDGRDPEPGVEHVWVAVDDHVAAVARILPEPDGAFSVGRIVTDPAHRGRGLAARVVRDSLDRVRARGGSTVQIGAQAQLTGWYRSLGFEVAGDRYLEDGILHVPMAQELAP